MDERLTSCPPGSLMPALLHMSGVCVLDAGDVLLIGWECAGLLVRCCKCAAHRLVVVLVGKLGACRVANCFCRCCHSH